MSNVIKLKDNLTAGGTLSSVDNVLKKEESVVILQLTYIYIYMHCFAESIFKCFLFFIFLPELPWHFDGSAQDCSNSIANALELLQSCTKPSICSYQQNGLITSQHWLSKWLGAKQATSDYLKQ